MKQRFKFTTYIKAVWRFLFYAHFYDMGGVIIEEPICRKYTFSHWLKVYKEREIVSKHGQQYLMGMTPKEMADYRV